MIWDNNKKLIRKQYFNEKQCKIDNLMWGVLKNEYVKKKSFYAKIEKVLHELM